MTIVRSSTSIERPLPCLYSFFPSGRPASAASFSGNRIFFLAAAQEQHLAERGEMKFKKAVMGLCGDPATPATIISRPRERWFSNTQATKALTHSPAAMRDPIRQSSLPVSAGTFLAQA